MRDAARPLAASLLAALWLLEEFHIASGGARVAAQLSLAVLCVYFVAGFAVARTAVRVVAAIALLAAGLLALQFGIAGSLLSGARSAALFIAFLATMQMLKVGIELRPGLERIRREHEALASREQHDAMLLRSWLAGSIFAAGTLAIVAPLVGPERAPAERRLLGQSALQGVGLALLWSPFFVAMAVCLKLSAGITLGAALANGVAMALLGLVISHVAFGGRLRAAWVAPLWRVFVATIAMALAIVVMHRTLGLSNSEAIVVGVPLVALLTAFQAVKTSPRSVALRWHASLEAIAAEALVVSASLILGEVIKDLLALGVVRLPAGMLTWPEPFLIVWPALVMVALSVAGFHPIIGASLLFPLQSSLPMLHPVVAAGSVLTGWMLAILLSTFAVPVMFAATLFRVAPRELVLGAGLRFALLYTPVAWFYLWILNFLLGANR
ncbi:hypothetical protein PE066_16550 [Ramlibacter tataouinensis]|uniref:hypothetical protein n=1 Tax=Ramlibacter tataouinensis TaxID=94132 RepID=UPI0022F3E645|nr:hypothetical protein [Ramlibacter tataouinensis]WBY01061.1 hypothetical protein PE066_16550 [Ramlibacter tataouinensis]